MGERVEIRVVCAAILRRGRVLVARRAEGQAQGLLWELPGGKVEPGEDDATALRRELREELGVDVVVSGPLGESLHAYPERDVRLVGWRCALVRGEPVALEHAELRWIGAEEVDALTWAPADRPLLGAVKAALG